MVLAGFVLTMLFAFIVFGVDVSEAFSAQASVYRSGSTQSISNLSTTAVQFNAENFDVDDAYSTSTYRYTAPVDGYYSFDVQASFQSGTASASVGYGFRLNGSTYTKSYLPLPTVTSYAVADSAVFWLDALEYVDFYFQPVGTSLTVQYVTNATYMDVYRLDEDVVATSTGLVADDIEPLWYGFGILLFFVAFFMVFYIIGLYRK